MVSPLPSSTHYVNGYFCIIVMFKSHIRVDAWVRITFLVQVIASIMYDGHSGMSVVTFRAAPPTPQLVDCLVCC